MNLLTDVKDAPSSILWCTIFDDAGIYRSTQSQAIRVLIDYTQLIPKIKAAAALLSEAVKEIEFSVLSTEVSCYELVDIDFVQKQCEDDLKNEFPAAIGGEISQYILAVDILRVAVRMEAEAVVYIDCLVNGNPDEKGELVNRDIWRSSFYSVSSLK